MDNFEKRYDQTEDFRLLVIPVEASIPRKREDEKPDPETEEKLEQKKSMRISREELYADIVGITELTRDHIIIVVLSTIVAAISIMRANVEVIIGAIVIAPFLGPIVAMALTATLGDNKLRKDAFKASVAGFFVVIVVSSIIGMLFTVDPAILKGSFCSINKFEFTDDGRLSTYSSRNEHQQPVLSDQLHLLLNIL